MKRKARENQPKVIWKQAKGLSEEGAKRKLDTAFDVLFSEVMKAHKKIQHIAR